MFDKDFLLSAMPSLLQGAIVTLQIALLSSFMGFILGTILAFLQKRTNPFLYPLITFYVTVLRGTPMLIQIPFWAYLLPEFGVNLSKFTTAVLAIGLNSSAYISQIIKSGISSVKKGQIEAAHVLGLTDFQTIRYIIFPQAIRIVIPALLNEFITLIKDSSLASTIGVYELFKRGSIIISQTYNAIPIFALIALIYLTLTTSLSLLSNYVERKLKYVEN